MEEKRILKLLEKTNEDAKTEVAKPQISHPNQTNPILKKLANFANSKIGEKFSIKDLLR